ncbi:hypothetical protein [Pantanalinema sp. GBBB05]|uniref:hypothetical protein n=1 Tax=Pantanalinema sp. GBBB05 TaxID=2604139 RepID=UPI001DD3F5F8|nr:hypothetical protein [Pantanalinema sp. GBBB05]
MNPKLLISLLLGIKAGVLLPMVSQAAVMPSTTDLLDRRSSIEVEVVDLNQTATQPILIADKNDSNNRRNNDSQRNRDSQRNNDSRRNSYRDNYYRDSYYRQRFNQLPSSLRRQIIWRGQQPIRVIQPGRGVRQIPTRYPDRNNDASGINVRVRF